jgi:carboxyl-terminal processing protease
VSKRIVAPVLLTVIVGTLLVQLPLAIAARSADYTWANPILDVWYLINTSFVEEVDPEDLRVAAIDGMVESLGDRYTAFVPARDIAEFDKTMRGTYVGIGASVRIEDGLPTVVSPMDDSPAFHAGLRAGDRILSIAGESTEGMDIDDAVELLSGTPGSEVTVTVLRNEVEELDITIVRQRIFTRTVKGYYREGENWRYLLDPDDGIAYLRITQFTETTQPQLAEALTMLSDEAKGYILDLRSNPGGILQGAVACADMFLEGEKTVVWSEGRTKPKQEYISSDEQTLVAPEVPVVVLINEDSASASEIFAGALRDHDRAVIVGTRSFGKGTVQTVVPLESNAGQLKITEAYYYLPSGRQVHRTDKSIKWGVDPTDGFYVSATRQERRDIAQWSYDADIIAQRGDEPFEPVTEPEAIREELNDPQLAAAAEALELRLATGEWEATGGDLDEEAIDAAALHELANGRERLLRELERVSRRMDALLAAGVSADAAENERDLLPDDAELAGGTLVVNDADGNEVARLAITGDDLERWLIDADVAKPDSVNGEADAPNAASDDAEADERSGD